MGADLTGCTPCSLTCGTSECCFNAVAQVLAELFAAYEQKVPSKVRQALATNRYITDDMFDSLPYNCPADKHLAVHFTQTPSVFSVPSFLHQAPTYIAYGFSLSFLAVCIAIGIFRPQKQMPSDYLQVRVSPFFSWYFGCTVSCCRRSLEHTTQSTCNRHAVNTQSTCSQLNPRHAQAQEFAQSKGKARKEGMTNVRFSDVAGIDTVREELIEIVQVGMKPRHCAELCRLSVLMMIMLMYMCTMAIV